MKLHVIHTGNFKLDGGAMHGVVPKSLWNKQNPSDDHNLCSWAMRCLLVETSDRLILIDNGIGDKQDEKFFGHYHLHGDQSLEKSLRSAGFGTDDITDVFLTHLHFDHCGGSIIRKNDKLVPAFRNARYWSNQKHWDWAVNPNAREKASFLKENILPIQESGQLNFISDGDELFDGFRVMCTQGHTESMMLPMIRYQDRTVVFMADLLPSVAHIPLPWIMAYDVRPLETLSEKERFLNEAAAGNYVLFFEHDLRNECCQLEKTDRGVRASSVHSLSELFKI